LVSYTLRMEMGCAIESLKRAVHLDPAQPRAWLGMAQAQYASEDLKQAAISADRAIEGDPELTDALLLRGRIALQANNPRGALSRAQAILRKEPKQPEAIYLLSQALEAMNRPTEALLALEKALSLSPNPQSMQIERVHLVRRSKGLEAGVTAIQELVAQNPHQPVYMALLAEWLSEAGRSEAAIQAARLALQEESGELLEDQRARLHILIGLRMRNTGQLDQAILHLDEAVAQQNLKSPGAVAFSERRDTVALKIFQRAMTIVKCYQFIIRLIGPKRQQRLRTAEAMLPCPNLP
jgi:tetratricopeptide (TPR) repeat protein